MRGLVYALLAIVSLLASSCSMGAVHLSEVGHQATYKLAIGVRRVVGHREKGNEQLAKFLGADATKNVIVEYGASWCPHCRNMQPIVDELGKTYIVYSVDVDKNRPLATEQKAFSLPTFVVYNNGVEVARYVGEQTAATLTQSVKTRAEQNPQPSPTPPDYHFKVQ